MMITLHPNADCSITSWIISSVGIIVFTDAFAFHAATVIIYARNNVGVRFLSACTQTFRNDLLLISLWNVYFILTFGARKNSHRSVFFSVSDHATVVEADY